MSLYGTKLYSTFLYGISTSFIISPSDGPSIGGQDFIVNGIGLDPRQFDDIFDGAILDLTKWVDISSGTGSVSLGSSYLNLSTGVTPGSIGGIESLNSWSDCQLEIRSILPVVTSNPAGDVNPVVFMLRVDANNYAVMKIILDTSGNYTLNCDVYRGGVSVGSFSTSCSHGLSVMRILRWDKSIYFIYQGSVIYTNSNFITTAVKARVYSNNISQNYDVTSLVDWFYWRTYVAFDEQIVHSPTVVSDMRLRGITPASINDRDISGAYAGLVDVSVVGATTATSVNAYEYYFRDRLRILNTIQASSLLSIINDDQLITKDNIDKGL